MREKQGHTFASPWTAQWDEESADWVVWGSVSEPDETGMTWQPTICSLSDCVGEDEARLIAAAPDLLEALIEMVRIAGHGQRFDDSLLSDEGQALFNATSIIAKATGEDSPANEGD